MSVKSILEKVKKSLEIIGAPITAIALVWGFDIGAYTSASITLLLSIISYIEFIVGNEKK